MLDQSFGKPSRSFITQNTKQLTQRTIANKAAVLRNMEYKIQCDVFHEFSNDNQPADEKIILLAQSATELQFMNENTRVVVAGHSHALPDPLPDRNLMKSPAKFSRHQNQHLNSCHEQHILYPEMLRHQVEGEGFVNERVTL